jgi:ubiquinol-cytochrome c reductase iron-sulfur subunit
MYTKPEHSGNSKGGRPLSHAEDTGSRRDFLYVATATTGAVAVGAAVWPLIDQMNASADVQALASKEVDISGVEVGTQLTVKWQGKPIFIRHRTDGEIEAGRNTPLEDLKDTSAENKNKPGAEATDENRALDADGKWLVMIGVCTHLGCIPLGGASGDFGGWFCPCHGSHYDTAGRIRKGPAPRNLDIPVMAFLSDTVIKIG